MLVVLEKSDEGWETAKNVSTSAEELNGQPLWERMDKQANEEWELYSNCDPNNIDPKIFNI